jgi:hypothetical protein
MSDDDEILPIGPAARRLRVPSRWLRAEIEAGRLPGLKAGSRLLVHTPTVAKLLARRARGDDVEGKR